MDLKQEINNSKYNIRNYKKILEITSDEEEKNHLYYLIKQEEIKLESFELLLSLSEKLRGKYE